MKRIVNNNIDKSLKIIDREKEKIKDEKKKIKLEKKKKFYKTFFGRFLLDFLDVSSAEKDISSTVKRRICYNFIYIMFGIFLCLIILFILSDGKNYLKLNYELSEFIDVYDTISNEYNGKINKKDLLDNAIDSMINSVGDVYTTYSNSEGAVGFFEDLKGSYEGIGCTVSMDINNNIYIVEVFEDSPAEKAGLKENDIILMVNNIDFLDKTSEEMANYIKYEADKKIDIKIKREEEELNVTIVREKVEISNVSSELIEQEGKKIGYIKINIFSAIADIQFEKELKKLEKKDIGGLIIDVRNNTGGYLDVVTNISSIFLEKDKIIYQLETGKKREEIKDKTKESRKYPVAVITNAGSASASEILAVSIKESYGGYVVGANTYGKGTVQKTKKLKDGSMIKYTVQNWLTPNGNYIDEKGISPTDVVDFKEEGLKNDSQLDYAVNLLKNVIK